MQRVSDIYKPPPELTLGKRMKDRVPEMDQTRQRAEVEEILRRFHKQPGVICRRSRHGEDLRCAGNRIYRRDKQPPWPGRRNGAR